MPPPQLIVFNVVCSYATLPAQVDQEDGSPQYLNVDSRVACGLHNVFVAVEESG